MRRFKLDERGNMGIVIPLVVLLAVGGAIMWTYNTLQTDSARGARDMAEVTRVAYNVLNRAKTLFTDKIVGCTGGVNSPNTKFALFRDLPSAVPPVIYTFTFSPAVNTFETCLLSTTESTGNSFVGSVDLEARRLDTPDRTQLTSLVSLTVRAASRGSGDDPLRRVTLTRFYTLKVARMSHYGIVLKEVGTFPGGQIELSSAQQRLRIMGSTFVATTSNTTLALIGGANSLLSHAAGEIWFDKTVDIRGKGFNNVTNPALETLRTVFRRGVRNSVLNFESVDYTFPNGLPFEDQGPTGTAWNQDVLYTRAGQNLVPHPWLDASTATNEPGFTFGLALGADSYLPPPGHQPTSYPDGALFPVGNLMTSCNPTTAPALPQLVFNQNTASVTINMDGNQGGDGLLCGLINADTVTFNLTNPAVNYFVGVIFANRIRVTGANGRMIILNPFDNTALPFSLPGNNSLVGLRNQFLSQSFQGPGKSFFAPVFRVIPPFEHESVRYRPGPMLTLRYNVIAGEPRFMRGLVYPNAAITNNVNNISNVAGTGTFWDPTVALYQRFVPVDSLLAPSPNYLDRVAPGTNAFERDLYGVGSGGFNDNLAYILEENE